MYCAWCGASLSGKRKHARFCSDFCRRSSFGADPCFYCGLPAAGRDHVIAQAMYDAVLLRWPHLLHKIGETVPACTECNSLAGARLFVTPGAKRRWLKSRLRERYAKVLAQPDWTEAELEQISGHALRSYILGAQEAKRLTRQRLSWPH